MILFHECLSTFAFNIFKVIALKSVIPSTARVCSLVSEAEPTKSVFARVARHPITSVRFFNRNFALWALFGVSIEPLGVHLSFKFTFAVCSSFIPFFEQIALDRWVWRLLASKAKLCSTNTLHIDVTVCFVSNNVLTACPYAVLSVVA